MPVRDLLSAASTQGASPADPYFYDVSLLLNGDGTNGAQNNTFLDSSTNNFTITRNGNTTQGSFSPYGNLWSNYFGSGNYFYINNTSNLYLSGDFTIEVWVNQTTVSGQYPIVQYRNGGNWVNGDFQIWTNNGAVYWDVPGGPQFTTSGTITAGTWNHIAVTRQSGVIRCYINGVYQTSVTDSTTYTGDSGTKKFFYNTDGSSQTYFPGYGSNLRINTTTALYTGTSSFTPSTTPLTAISGTGLLTCQSNRFIDNSSNAFAITVNGSPSVQRFSPFNPTAPYDTSVIGGSGYFDGSGSLSVSSSNTVLPSGTQDFSVECYVYWGTQSQSYPQIICNPTTNGFQIYYDVGSGQLDVGIFNVANLLTYTIAQSALANTWQHIAVTRSGNTFRLFVNGVLQANGTNTISFASPTTQYIGSDGSRPFVGYLSSVRTVLGSIPTSYQTSSTTNGTSVFTPPTAPVTAITNTALLSNMTNAGIPDLAMQNNLQTVGSAQVSTSVKKYGTGSLSFDGTNSALLTPSSPLVSAWTGDFTIECWVYANLSQYFNLWCNSTSNSDGITGGYIATNGSVGLGRFGVNEFTTSAGAVTSNTWTHIAWVGYNGTAYIYVNGVSSASGSQSTYVTTTTKPITLGRNYQTSPNYALGYIDDFRVTYGLARYTANFTPPISALPTY